MESHMPVYVAGFERGVRPMGALVDAHDLVEMGDTLQAEVERRGSAQRGGALSQRTMQDVEHERALTGPADARQDGERPQRKADVDPLEVVGARAADGEGMPVSSTALGTAGDFARRGGTAR